MENQKMAVIATDHIDAYTARWLDKEECQLPIYPKMTIDDSYGWFILAVDWDYDEDTIDDVPKPLQDCLRLAVSEGCDWLCIDRDAPIDERLKTYNW